MRLSTVEKLQGSDFCLFIIDIDSKFFMQIITDQGHGKHIGTAASAFRKGYTSVSRVKRSRVYKHYKNKLA